MKEREIGNIDAIKFDDIDKNTPYRNKNPFESSNVSVKIFKMAVSILLFIAKMLKSTPSSYSELK